MKRILLLLLLGSILIYSPKTVLAKDDPLGQGISDYLGGNSAGATASPETVTDGSLEERVGGYFSKSRDNRNDSAMEGDLADSYQQYYESSGANELYSGLPDETKSFLQDTGLYELDADLLIHMDFGTFVKVLFQNLAGNIKKPLAVLSVILGMVLLASMMGMLRTTSEGGTSGVFSVVSVLCIGGVIITPVIGLIQHAITMLEEVDRFVLGFVPVYAGIIAASGKPVSAFTYNTMLMSVTQVISHVIVAVIIPLICIYFALTVLGSASPHIEIGGITSAIRSSVVWSLGLFLTVFVGMLTIKSFVAGSADTVTFRAGRFMVSSMIPIVGGAVGESLSIVQGSLGVIKTSVGAFGIIVLLITFLPLFIELMLMSFALKISQAVSEALDVGDVSKLLSGAQFALSLMLAVLVCFAVMLIISVSLMMVIGTG